MTAEPNPSRESPAISSRIVATIMASFVTFTVIAAVCLSFFFFQPSARNAAFVKAHAFPAPRLETLSDGTREPQIAEQQADLRRFRWIDRKHRVFQIPIERAMRLVAARGARAYDPVAPASSDASPPAGPPSPRARGGPTR
ncbi:MAG: hypothetical protein JO288_17390 [Hyphomicrobiales bacterium]|nr:hypothetical protein [Hyphomicrobiales bacterium]